MDGLLDAFERRVVELQANANHLVILSEAHGILGMTSDLKAPIVKLGSPFTVVFRIGTTGTSLRRI